ncbi:GxxExxY protein [Terrimonas alba]|uniref:GxxExxY protein n=1 Tax=Terrimonas alba TaxID=3349636 RepID=UPI0035F4EF63
MNNMLYKSEVYEIVGACMEVHRTLGFGFLEVVYKDAMELEFVERDINFLREDEHSVNYKGKTLKHKFFADFTLFDNIIVEVKANKDGIPVDAIAQTLNYLKVSRFRLGLLINFGKTSLEYKRLIF